MENKVQERTINLLLALTTGRVWAEHGGGPPFSELDMWDCEWFMDFVKQHVCDTLSREMSLNKEGSDITAVFYHGKQRHSYKE